ncbi:hypothetical protein HK098_006402 [Nowakowskiella sp. JEL0407]|nr:hypothetical protein HK098_006402 [Nowakowskiella sp. JEL0407]
MDVEKITLQNLSKESTNRKTKKGLLPGVPFIVFMLIVLVAVLCGSIIPPCSLVFTTSAQTINSLTHQIALSTVRTSIGKLQDLMLDVQNGVEMFMSLAELEDMMLHDTEGYEFHPNVTVSAFQALSGMRNVQAIHCFQRENLTGQISLSAKTADMEMYRNMTLVSFFNVPSGMSFVPGSWKAWADYTDSQNVKCVLVDPATGTELAPKINLVSPIVHPTKAAWLYTRSVSLLDDPREKPVWNSEGADGMTYFSYFRPGNDRTRKYKGATPFICGSSMFATKAVKTLRQIIARDIKQFF